MRCKYSIFLVVAVAGVLLGSTLVNQTQGQGRRDRKATARKPASFVHTVIFYLKKGAPETEADALIADAQKLLSRIPTVREIRAGRPADKATPITIKDYQVGLLVLFDDADGLQTYLDHPLHKEYVSNHEKSFEKVVVYDFVGSNP
jgi:hypothetical protein